LNRDFAEILSSLCAAGAEFLIVGAHALEVEGLPVGCIGRADLIANKRAAGRPKDLADLALLESEA
jgi:hypothetical protein